MASSASLQVLLGCNGNLAEKYLWQSLFDLWAAHQQIIVFPGGTAPAETGQGALDGVLQVRRCCTVDADP